MKLPTILLFAISVALISQSAFAQNSPKPEVDAKPTVDETTSVDVVAPENSFGRYEALIAGLTIFVLAVFVGFEVITKVPPTLHTPLMSGSNAISGISLVGAVIVTGAVGYVSAATGFVAVVLATINVIGGFWVTHRMLAMFAGKKKKPVKA